MKPSELPGTRSLYRLTNRALDQIKELWQYAGEDELPPDSFLQAQVEALRILHIEVPLSAKRQFQLFCSEHFPGLADLSDTFGSTTIPLGKRTTKYIRWIGPSIVSEKQKNQCGTRWRIASHGFVTRKS